MKKYLLIILGFLFASNVAFSQNQFLVATQDTNYLWGPDSLLMTAHAAVVNNGGGMITVKVKRMQHDTAFGQTSIFCWQGTCFPSNFVYSNNTVDLNPGQSDTTLWAELQPSHHGGTSVISYCFYDVDDTLDTACVTFTYKVSSVGISELGPLHYLSGIYPNPADNYARLNYALASGKEAKIIITNVLGSKIKEMIISSAEKQGTLIIPTTEFNTGVYMCNFMIDGNSVASRRMIVNHR